MLKKTLKNPKLFVWSLVTLFAGTVLIIFGSSKLNWALPYLLFAYLLALLYIVIAFPFLYYDRLKDHYPGSTKTQRWLQTIIVIAVAVFIFYKPSSRFDSLKNISVTVVIAASALVSFLLFKKGKKKPVKHTKK